MRLVEVKLTPSNDEIPPDVARLLKDAKQQIDAMEDASRVAIPAFVPSDFELVYRALVAIEADHLATGRRLLEWGSGLGVITCLAVLVGLDAAGIEIEPKLVHRATELAKRHRIEAQFTCGTFVPHNAEIYTDTFGDVAWLAAGGADGYEALQLEPDDFDIVFAYPWPGEEQVIFDLFTGCAAAGALLLTYQGQEGLRLMRKTRR
jgi:hypothetical protein